LRKIILATGNKDKLREIQNIWKDIKEIELDWMGNYPGVEEIEETGTTLEENAAIKAKYIAEKFNCVAVADDTGFFVDYLNGSPGVYSARYAGENATYVDNVDKILNELKDVPEEKRNASFRCVVCMTEPGKDEVFTEGIVEGVVAEECRGEDGFGYDPVFEVTGTGKTYAEMSLEEKNTLSHRYIAFKKMGEYILATCKNGG
jgi:XTP/dITP diphosphohydrolase